MITWYRVWAKVKQTHRIHFNSFEALVDFVYWPVLNIVLWGLNALAQRNSMHPDYILSLLTCLVLFRCFVQAYLDIAMKFLHELWSKNAINLFVSPLSMSEWVVAACITGAYSSFINLGIGITATWLLLGIKLWAYPGLLLSGLLLAILSGSALGMLTLSIILKQGARAEKLVWLLAFGLSPFMGIYYPIATLPVWARTIGYTIPTTHGFSVIWNYINNGFLDTSTYLLALTGAIAWWICAWCVVHLAYRSALKQGLMRLEDV